jgi:hypothetical protein
MILPEGRLPCASPQANASTCLPRPTNRPETFHVGSKSILIANRRDVIVGDRFSTVGYGVETRVRRFFLT